MRVHLVVDGATHEVVLEPTGEHAWTVHVDGDAFEVTLVPKDPGTTLATAGDVDVQVHRAGRAVRIDDVPVAVAALGLARGGQDDHAQAAGEVHPPMPGRVRDILVAEGDVVAQGQALLVLEAMKMRNELPAPGEGRVARILVEEGQAVETSDVLLVLEPAA